MRISKAFTRRSRLARATPACCKATFTGFSPPWPFEPFVDAGIAPIVRRNSAISSPVDMESEESVMSRPYDRDVREPVSSLFTQKEGLV